MKFKRIKITTIMTLTISLVVNAQEIKILKGATLIDGTGRPPIQSDIQLQGKRIVKIGKGLDQKGAEVIDLTGKIIMPALISDHTHIGNVKGVESSGKFYTREHILEQLKRYSDYGDR